MAQGMKNTVLDHLPAGTDADLAKGKIPHTLPDGVTNRAVYQDILQIALPASVELILSSFTSMADLGNHGSRPHDTAKVYPYDNGHGDECRFHRTCCPVKRFWQPGSCTEVCQTGNVAQPYFKHPAFCRRFCDCQTARSFHGCKGWAHFKCRNCLLADSDGRIRILFPDLDHHSASSRNWRFQNSHVL